MTSSPVVAADAVVVVDASVDHCSFVAGVRVRFHRQWCFCTRRLQRSRVACSLADAEDALAAGAVVAVDVVGAELSRSLHLPDTPSASLQSLARPASQKSPGCC